MIRRLSRTERDEAVARVLAAVGIAEQRDKYPDQLLDGQRQRVAVARALILADEPTANLDHASAGMVIDLMRQMLSTHDPRIVKQAETLYTLSEGRLVDVGADKGKWTMLNVLRLGENMWLFISNVGKPTRITSLQSVVGGVFNNADIMRLDYHIEYEVAELGEDEGQYLFFFKVKTGQMAYDKLRMWVEKKTLMPTKVACVLLHHRHPDQDALPQGR